MTISFLCFGNYMDNCMGLTKTISGGSLRLSKVQSAILPAQNGDVAPCHLQMKPLLQGTASQDFIKEQPARNELGKFWQMKHMW